MKYIVEKTDKEVILYLDCITISQTATTISFAKNKSNAVKFTELEIARAAHRICGFTFQDTIFRVTEVEPDDREKVVLFMQSYLSTHYHAAPMNELNNKVFQHIQEHHLQISEISDQMIFDAGYKIHPYLNGVGRFVCKP